MIRWVGLSIAALLVGIHILGCGGESDVSAAAVRQLNSACLANNEKAAAEILEVYDEPRVKRADSERKAINLEVEFFFPILLANAEAQAQAIRSVDSPGDDEERMEAILDAYEAWIEEAEQAPLKVVLANDVYNEARELAGGYGLVNCTASPYEIGPDSGTAQAAQTG